MKTLEKIIIFILIIFGLIGSVILTIWMWKILPRWLIFGLYGIDIIIGIFFIHRIIR